MEKDITLNQETITMQELGDLGGFYAEDIEQVIVICKESTYILEVNR